MIMRKPQPSEHTEWFIKKQVRKILGDTGWKYWMPSSNLFGQSGVSDFLCVKSPGLFMAIETKYDSAVTSLQFKFLTEVHAAGHSAFLVDETNVDVLREVLMAAPRLMHTHPKYHLLNKWRDQNTIPYDISITGTLTPDL